MKTQPVYGLVCAGGGAHGAYQVGVLKFIHEKFSHGNKSPFQIFSGTSCGSLNTTFYAAQSFDAFQSRLWLEELWMGFHVPAYHGNILKNALKCLIKEWKMDPEERNTAWAILDPKPMLDVIRKGFIRGNLEKSLALGTTLGLAVAATELVSGRNCWFMEGKAARTWNLFHSIGVIEPINAFHVAASCSIPFFLPPVKIGNHYYLDGNLSQTRPFTAAITMRATKILSISTEKPSPHDLPEYPEHFRPRLGNVMRLVLNRLSHDSAADEARQIHTLNLFSRFLSRKHQRKERIQETYPLFHEESLPSHYRTTEIMLFYPTKRIRESIGWNPNVHHLKAGAKGTRFMFHEKFIKELIDLGYEDAKAKESELRTFFLDFPESPRSWLNFLRNKPEPI